MPAPTAQDFRRELNNIFDIFMKIQSYQGAVINIPAYIEINAGGLHKRLGYYPGNNHRMPNCCSVMKQCMKSDDTIVEQPSSGQGASLTIRYQLPRPLC